MVKFLSAIVNLLFFTLIYLYFSYTAEAVTIAEQTKDYSSNLSAWQIVQELGDNLTGVAQNFTFRVKTNRSNSTQFDFTGQISQIYDKTNNTFIFSCVPAGSNPNDKLRGLTFTKTNVPEGYQDVTLDFSCRNYTFNSTHKYLIYITNANLPNSVANLIQFAASSFASSGADNFTAGGIKFANGNRWDFANNSGSCNAEKYIYSSQSNNNGCYIWTHPKDDIYFTFSNTSPPPPPPKIPVIFVPGIGGSEFKASQDIFWNADNGHGGTFSHAYKKDEQIWVNQDEAVKIGDDDYFDILKLKPDGQTPEADLAITGNLSPFGYGEIDPFFTELGYEKGKNFFIFPYDWRKDVSLTKNDLDALIETAKQKSGQSQVNIVAHSMGGLVARNYTLDSEKAKKVNSLITLGTPYLGSVEGLKGIMYGTPLGKPVFRIFNIGITDSEVQDILQNLISAFQLLPSIYYFNYYDNSEQYKPYPFQDERDIDNNNIIGQFNYIKIKELLKNLNYNQNTFAIAETFHNSFDSQLNQSNGVKLHNIVGTGQPTLGQIKETWWVTWPIKLIPKYEETFINGDETVPLYSASLKSDSKDLSAGAKIYYVEQTHSDLVSKNGAAMQAVKSILSAENSLPVEVRSEKINLEGEHLSIDDDIDLDLYEGEKHAGINNKDEIENNIPNVFFDRVGKSKQAFIKKSAKKVKVKLSRKKTDKKSKPKTNLKIRSYSKDKITKTAVYPNLSLEDESTVEFTLDPTNETPPTIITESQNLTAIETATSLSLDQTPPVSEASRSGGIINIISSDDSSGVLQTEYSLDNGETVQTYTQPITLANTGEYTLQYFSTDKSGNQEKPKILTFNISQDSSTPSATITQTSTISQSTSSNSPSVIPSEVDTSTESRDLSQLPTNPDAVISLSKDSSTLPPMAGFGRNDKQENHNGEHENKKEVLGITSEDKNTPLKDLLIKVAAFGGVASAGLAFTFFKPTPK